VATTTVLSLQCCVLAACSAPGPHPRLVRQCLGNSFPYGRRCETGLWWRALGRHHGPSVLRANGMFCTWTSFCTATSGEAYFPSDVAAKPARQHHGHFSVACHWHVLHKSLKDTLVLYGNVWGSLLPFGRCCETAPLSGGPFAGFQGKICCAWRCLHLFGCSCKVFVLFGASGDACIPSDAAARLSSYPVALVNSSMEKKHQGDRSE
jgi:hypothetical protein